MFPDNQFMITTVPQTDVQSFHYYIIDHDFNLLAYSSLDCMSIYGDKAELIFETENCQSVVKATLEKAKALFEDAYEFPNRLLYHDTYYYSSSYMDPDTEKWRQVQIEADTMKVDRFSLPAHARGFTRYSWIGYYVLPPESLARGSVQVQSMDDIDISKRLLEERLNYVLVYHGRREGYTSTYRDERGISGLVDSSWTSRFALLILLLQDDAGVLRAYTHFTADDLARMARR
ncbi:MAG: hypothetical protein ACOYEQ_04760 [Bacillota bacterium]|jgi:hypothetical protein